VSSMRSSKIRLASSIFMFASCQVTHLASTFSVCSTNTPCCWGPACTQKPTIDFPSSPGDASYPAQGMHHILLRGGIISYSGDASYPTQGMHPVPLKGCIISYIRDASHPIQGMHHIPLTGCIISHSKDASSPTQGICMHCWHLTS